MTERKRKFSPTSRARKEVKYKPEELAGGGGGELGRHVR
jgi:hypothetical protein